MGILDDAIKEHLDLKRQHGAAEDELRRLEDEAFGAAERPGEPDSAPDPLAEAPTEFMAQPGVEEAGETEEPAAERRPHPDVADLQEPPPPPEPGPGTVEPPTEEESPAIEQAIPEPPPEPPPPAEPEPPLGPSTEEREAIAEQPTEMFDVEEELGGSEAPAEAEEEEEEIDDDFWDEKRLSDELDQALDGPSEADEEEALYEDAAGEADEPEEEQPQRPAPSGDEEDVLEETPDFLDEDEDDQLWFEQKPPKDFDFDD